MRLLSVVSLALCLTASLASAAPLTLAQALRTVEQGGHPDETLFLADTAAVRADLLDAQSRTDWTVTLDGVLRQGVQPYDSSQWKSDNQARLTARYPLLDAGRSSERIRAAQADLDARNTLFVAQRDQRRYEVMQRFFAVLLADLQFTADNENMAVQYVNFDQSRDKLQQGQISRVDLAEAESRYQDSMLTRNASQLQQRITRARLAESMNQPGKLADDLADPPLDSLWQRKLPDVAELQQLAEQHNPRLQALQQQLQAEEARMAGVRADYKPQLDVELQAADYARPAVTRDNLSAGVLLTIPLWQGRREDARLAREQAQWQKLQAQRARLLMDIQQGVLETALQIEQLQGAARGAVQKLAAYRDLALERSRGLYELELKTNLGTSMVEVMHATVRGKKVQYELALAWERLRDLTGVELNQ